MQHHSNNCGQTDIKDATMGEQPTPVVGSAADKQLTGEPDNSVAGANTTEFHPLAEIFPELDADRLGELATDIKKNGLIDPLIMHEGKILDGRNRYAACKMAGVEPRYVDYEGHDPVGFIVSRNLHRRQLSDSQRAMVAAKLATLGRGANQHSEGLPLGRASDIMNVSERSAARARKVLKNAITAVADALKNGTLPVAEAERISGLPKSEQPNALQEWVKNKGKGKDKDKGKGKGKGKGKDQGKDQGKDRDKDQDKDREEEHKKDQKNETDSTKGSTETPPPAPAPEPKHELTPEQKSADALAAFKAACNTECPLMTEADLKQARVYLMEQRWKPRGPMKAA